MELINLVFRLGVVFAIFSFIWFFISLGLKILTGVLRSKPIGEVYFLKLIQYLFLVNVTFLICSTESYSSFNIENQIVLGGIILLIYFLGKLQNNQKKRKLIRLYTNGLQSKLANQFNIKYEIIVLAVSLICYTSLYFYPDYSLMSFSISMKNAVMNIEDTPIFGFIFKVIGFFFMINVFSKLFKTILLLLTGQLFKQHSSQENSGFDDHNNQDDKFDDFEEIKDELNQ